MASPPDNCGALSPAASSTIEGGIETASPGDTVNVCPGTYTEQVSFEVDESNITLRSLVFRAAVIKAPPLVMAEPGDLITINGAQSVTLRDFTIADNIGVYTTTGARIVRNVILDSTFYDGIFMGADTSDNRIEGNFLRGNAEHDCHDDSGAPPPSPFVLNLWIDNDGLTDNRGGSLCEIDDDDDDRGDED